MEALYEAFYTDNLRSVLLSEYSATSALSILGQKIYERKNLTIVFYLREES